jgi:hypothetical protein
MLDEQHTKAAPMIKKLLEEMGGLYNKAAQVLDLIKGGNTMSFVQKAQARSFTLLAHVVHLTSLSLSLELP